MFEVFEIRDNVGKLTLLSTETLVDALLFICDKHEEGVQFRVTTDRQNYDLVVIDNSVTTQYAIETTNKTTMDQYPAWAFEDSTWDWD